MKKIFLLVALAILSATTLSALAPAKVAIINTGGGAVNVEIKLANYVTGTANILYTQPLTSYTPNGSGLILADLSGAGWTAITPASVTSYYILDVYIGGTLSAQHRLDQLLLAQGQSNVFDNNGNFTPSTDNTADLGSSSKKWKDLYVAGNAVIDGLTVGQGGGNNATNTAFGKEALNSNTTGVNNTANGNQALKSNTIGNFNTAFGESALRDNVDGQRNTALGQSAHLRNIDGIENVFLGYNSGFDVGQITNANNSIAIGAYVNTTASNQVVIGNNAITETKLKGKLQNTVTNANTLAALTAANTTVINYTAPTGTILNADLPAAAAGTFLYIYLANSQTFISNPALTANRVYVFVNIDGTNWRRTN